MSINDDFTNKAEAEMKLHDAKMMEQAQLRKITNASLQERIFFALTKRGNNAEDAFEYMKEHHLILAGEIVTVGDIEKAKK